MGRRVLVDHSDDQVSAVAYKGRTLTRDGVNGAGIVAPNVTDATKVTVPADAVCGSAAAPATCAPIAQSGGCLLYTSPSPRDRTRTRMPLSA